MYKVFLEVDGNKVFIGRRESVAGAEKLCEDRVLVLSKKWESNSISFDIVKKFGWEEKLNYHITESKGVIRERVMPPSQDRRLTFEPKKLGNKTLIEFYDYIGESLGYDPNEGGIQYDCTKICISENVQDHLMEAYELRYPDLFASRRRDAEMEVIMILACSGPKVDHELPMDSVDVFEGFFIREGKELVEGG